FQHRERDARFVAEAADAAVTGIEGTLGARRGGQGVPAPVVVANVVAELAVGAGAAELLDPRVLVGRHGLRCELTADPIGLLGHDHAAALAQRRQRGRDASGAASYNYDIGCLFSHRAVAPVEVVL